MKDWMDDDWQDFIDRYQVDTDAMPKADVLLLKQAWLHGARSSFAHARNAVDEFMTATKDVQP